MGSRSYSKRSWQLILYVETKLINVPKYLKIDTFPYNLKGYKWVKYLVTVIFDWNIIKTVEIVIYFYLNMVITQPVMMVLLK